MASSYGRGLCSIGKSGDSSSGFIEHLENRLTRKFRQYYRPIVSRPRFWCDASSQPMTGLSANRLSETTSDEEASTSASKQILISFAEAYGMEELL